MCVFDEGKTRKKELLYMTVQVNIFSEPPTQSIKTRSLRRIKTVYDLLNHLGNYGYCERYCGFILILGGNVGKELPDLSK